MNYDNLIRTIFFGPTFRISRIIYKKYLNNIINYPNLTSYLLNRFVAETSIENSLMRIAYLFRDDVSDENKLRIENSYKCPICGKYIPFIARHSKPFQDTCGVDCAARYRVNDAHSKGQKYGGFSEEAIVKRVQSYKLGREMARNSENVFIFSGIQYKNEKYDNYIVDLFLKPLKTSTLRIQGSLYNIFNYPDKQKKYTNIINYISNRYPDSQSPNETIFRIKYGIEIRPVCQCCGGAKGVINFIGKANCGKYKTRPFPFNLFETYCSNSCANSGNSKKSQKTKLGKYGSVNNSKKIVETFKANHGEDGYSIQMKLIQANMTPEQKQIASKKRMKTYNERYGANGRSDRMKTVWSELTEEEKNERNEHIKQTKTERHGEDYGKYNAYITSYHCMLKHGVSHYMKVPELRELADDKREQTTGYRCSLSDPSVRAKAEETCLKNNGVRYGILLPEVQEKLRSSEIQQKKYQTHKKNNSFNSSSKEDEIGKYILSIFPNTIFQYNDSRYVNTKTLIPYNCDYYIPELDLFIEYQGSQYHHNHPFDKNNPDDLNEIIRLKERSKYLHKQLENSDNRNNQCDRNNQYDNIIECWTKRDVLKRKSAKLNNINYLEIWPNDNYKEIINNLYNKYIKYE